MNQISLQVGYISLYEKKGFGSIFAFGLNYKLLNENGITTELLWHLTAQKRKYP